jgi:hypothetical protein
VPSICLDPFSQRGPLSAGQIPLTTNKVGREQTNQKESQEGHTKRLIGGNSPQCLLFEIDVHLAPIGHEADQNGNKSTNNLIFFKRGFGDPGGISSTWIFEECSVRVGMNGFRVVQPWFIGCM